MVETNQNETIAVESGRKWPCGLPLGLSRRQEVHVHRKSSGTEGGSDALNSGRKDFLTGFSEARRVCDPKAVSLWSVEGIQVNRSYRLDGDGAEIK